MEVLSFVALLFVIMVFLFAVLSLLSRKPKPKIASHKIIGKIKPVANTVVVTGANSGLGYKCARSIARRNLGFHVIIACRSQTRAEKAVDQLIEETNNQNISYLLLDLASQESIRTFCNEIAKLPLPPLFGVVCNAVFSPVGSSHTINRTKDNIESTFGVGHLGHFLLCNLLIPRIQKGGRIVFVSSDMHDPPSLFGIGKLKWVDPTVLAFPERETSEKERKGKGKAAKVKMPPMMRYSYCKLSNIYCTYEMARRLRERRIEVSVNAFNPGMMNDTHESSQRIFGFVMRFMRDYIVEPVAWVLGRLGNSELSSEQLADLVTEERWEKTTGKYIDRGVEKKSSELSYSRGNAEELWKISQKLASLDETI